MKKHIVLLCLFSSTIVATQAQKKIWNETEAQKKRTACLVDTRPFWYVHTLGDLCIGGKA